MWWLHGADAGTCTLRATYMYFLRVQWEAALLSSLLKWVDCIVASAFVVLGFQHRHSYMLYNDKVFNFDLQAAEYAACVSAMACNLVMSIGSEGVQRDLRAMHREVHLLHARQLMDSPP